MSNVTSADWGSRFLTALSHHAAAAPKPVIRVAATVRPVAIPVTGGIISPALLARLGGRDPVEWAPILSDACERHGITTPRRLAAWLANILNETGGLSTLAEGLNYTPASLLKQWPSHFTAVSAQRLGRTSSHPADQQGIANAAYGGRGGNCKAGDGWLFRGAGCLQTTFRGNFQALATVISWTQPLEQLPAYLQTREGAAISAAIFWEQHPGCNEAADQGDITTVRRIVNGGTIGLAPVRVRYADACTAMGIH